MGYVLHRLAEAVVVLLLITMVAFSVIHLAPGDPIRSRVDPRLGPEMEAAIREVAVLDVPLPARYLIWLRGVLQGDLGLSFRYGRPVAELIAERLGPTVLLAASAQLLGVALGVPLGVLAAAHRGRWLDWLTTGAALAGFALPPFFVGLLLLRLLALRWQFLPTGGMITPGLAGGPLAQLADLLRHLALPALVLGLAEAGYLARYVRSSLLEVLGQEYVRTARAKGLTERAVLFRHALRSALLPIITLLGLSLPALVGGAVITETIFQWPGLGRLGYTAALERDYPVQMAFLLMTGAMTLLGNLLADIGYAVADPRVRHR